MIDMELIKASGQVSFGGAAVDDKLCIAGFHNTAVALGTAR